MQLVLGLPNAVAVIAIHHENEALGVLEVVPPEGANLRREEVESSPARTLKSSRARATPYLVLAADVPNGEADVLVLNSLHVETYAGRSQGSAGALRPREPEITP